MGLLNLENSFEVEVAGSMEGFMEKLKQQTNESSLHIFSLITDSFSALNSGNKKFRGSMELDRFVLRRQPQFTFFRKSRPIAVAYGRITRGKNRIFLNVSVKGINISSALIPVWSALIFLLISIQTQLFSEIGWNKFYLIIIAAMIIGMYVSFWMSVKDLKRELKAFIDSCNTEKDDIELL